MPYKFNESRRDKITKAKYKVTNWPEYNAALRKRGDFTLYFSEEAIAGWRPERTGKRGRPQEYSDAAIDATLLIRQVFHLPLRQTEGLMTALARVMQADIAIPDFSSISRRSVELPRHLVSKAMTPGSVVMVDSSGLKVYGKDEWHQEKHAVAARRTWRKLHIAVDEKHQIAACELTTPEVGDPTAVPDLLDQIETPFETFMGDGAYDGEPVAQAVLDHQPDAKVVVPPHKTAVVSAAGDTQRDGHIQTIANLGRMAWQMITGYHLRNYVELAVQRYKRIFGNTMKARLASAKSGGRDQCVRTQHHDQSGHAALRENLKNSPTAGLFRLNFDLRNNADMNQSALPAIIYTLPMTIDIGKPRGDIKSDGRKATR